MSSWSLANWAEQLANSVKVALRAEADISLEVGRAFFSGFSLVDEVGGFFPVDQSPNPIFFELGKVVEREAVSNELPAGAARSSGSTNPLSTYKRKGDLRTWNSCDSQLIHSPARGRATTALSSKNRLHDGRTPS